MALAVGGVGSLLVAPYQAELNGVLMGANTPYVLTVFNPFNSPTVRTDDRDLPLQHGVVGGFDLYGSRTIEFEITVKGQGVDMYERVAALAAAFKASPNTSILAFSLEGEEKRKFYGRPRRLAFRPQNYGVKNVTAIAEFVATDPRMYELGDRVTGSISPIAPGGLEFPAEAPFDFGIVGSAGVILIENIGTMPTPWAALLAGPVTDPSIYHIQSDSFFNLYGTIADGDTMFIDATTRTVVLNGTANRMNMVAPGSIWFELVSGHNEIRFNSGSSTGGVLIQWSSAWY